MCPKWPGHRLAVSPQVLQHSCCSVGPNAGSYRPPAVGCNRESKVSAFKIFPQLILCISLAV